MLLGSSTALEPAGGAVFGEAGGAHSAEARAPWPEGCWFLAADLPQSKGGQKKKHDSNWTARLRRFAKFQPNIPPFASTPSPPPHAHHPLLSPLASADAPFPARTIVHCIFSRHPASIRRSQWPEARASRLEGRAPAVRRAPKEPRSSRATLPEPVFR